jgi:predicted lysophospholipase L1 biosynthesis ABC-type transport system permease subunit
MAGAAPMRGSSGLQRSRRGRALAKATLLLFALAAALLALYRLLDSTALDVLRYRFSFAPVIFVLLLLNFAALIGGILLNAAYRSLKRDWQGGDAEPD